MIDDLFLNLTTIGNVEPYDKLLVHYGILYIDPYSHTRAFRRKFQGHNRHDVLRFVSVTIKYAIIQGNAILDRFRYIPDLTIDGLKASHREDLLILFTSLLECKTGLSNLSTTYEDDRNMLSGIDVIVTSIDNFISDCNNVDIRNNDINDTTDSLGDTISF